MKTFKTIGIGLLAVIVLLLVISFFLPSAVHVERSRVVKADAGAVYAQLNDLRNWNNWMPWNQKDPNMQITYGNVTQGSGASYTWHSQNSEVGDGKLDISKCEPNKEVCTDMDFMSHGKATGNFMLEPADGGTKVTWSMDSNMGMNPVGKFMGLFMDKMVGPDFEKGLTMLETAAQQHPVTPAQPQAQAMPTDATHAQPEAPAHS